VTQTLRGLLFDVGGVLVQLSGVETMLGWMGKNATSDEMWHMWPHSATSKRNINL
jgi:hypothetical protein